MGKIIDPFPEPQKPTHFCEDELPSTDTIERSLAFRRRDNKLNLYPLYNNSRIRCSCGEIYRLHRDTVWYWGIGYQSYWVSNDGWHKQGRGGIETAIQ